jgi:hypothetical protein
MEKMKRFISRLMSLGILVGNGFESETETETERYEIKFGDRLVDLVMV